MRKHSFLTRMFNEKIGQCKESGLIDHWLAKYTRHPMKMKHIKPHRLGIPNILAILQISAVMWVISFIVFLLEVFSPPHGFVRKVLDFLTYWKFIHEPIFLLSFRSAVWMWTQHLPLNSGLSCKHILIHIIIPVQRAEKHQQLWQWIYEWLLENSCESGTEKINR